MYEFNYKNYFDVSRTRAEALFKTANNVYEVIPKIGDFIKELILTLNDEFEEVAPLVYKHKTATVANTASITGPCIIDENTEVRHCAFIRGNALIGKNCVVGNSTELKNVILFDNVQVPHYNYVGDSVLGYKSHMGAASITSNVKSDKSLVQIKFNGKSYNTGLKKFGAIISDNVEIGCGSVLNPGTIIGKNSNIYPLSSVRGVVAENSIYKCKSEIVLKTESR